MNITLSELNEAGLYISNENIFNLMGSYLYDEPPSFKDFSAHIDGNLSGGRGVEGGEGRREGERVRQLAQGIVSGREGRREHSLRFFGPWRRRSSRQESGGLPTRRVSEGEAEGRRDGGGGGERKSIEVDRYRFNLPDQKSEFPNG